MNCPVLTTLLAAGLLCAPQSAPQVAEGSVKGGTERIEAADPPTFEERVRQVDAMVEKVVFCSLKEVSLQTYGEMLPGPTSAGELIDDITLSVVARLERIGLKVVEDDISARPRLVLNLRLIELPGAKFDLAYYVELTLQEKVRLDRPASRDPIGITHRFSSAGQFRRRNLAAQMKRTSNELLDRLERALKAANPKP